MKSVVSNPFSLQNATSSWLTSKCRRLSRYCVRQRPCSILHNHLILIYRKVIVPVLSLSSYFGQGRIRRRDLGDAWAGKVNPSRERHHPHRHYLLHLGTPYTSMLSGRRGTFACPGLQDLRSDICWLAHHGNVKPLIPLPFHSGMRGPRCTSNQFSTRL